MTGSFKVGEATSSTFVIEVVLRIGEVGANLLKHKVNFVCVGGQISEALASRYRPVKISFSYLLVEGVLKLCQISQSLSKGRCRLCRESRDWYQFIQRPKTNTLNLFANFFNCAAGIFRTFQRIESNSCNSARLRRFANTRAQCDNMQSRYCRINSFRFSGLIRCEPNCAKQRANCADTAGPSSPIARLKSAFPPYRDVKNRCKNHHDNGSEMSVDEFGWFHDEILS